jgi:DNA-binding MarR family transcriptional regulator
LSKLSRLGAMPIGKLAATMVMERTALSRAIGPLERDGMVKVGAGPNGRTRSVKLTPTGETRLKAAAAHWRRAQKEFEIAVGAADAADLRTVLQHVISVT